MALITRAYMTTKRIRALWRSDLSNDADERLLMTGEMAAQMIDDYCGVSFIPERGSYSVVLSADDNTTQGQIVGIAPFSVIDTITLNDLDIKAGVAVTGDSRRPCTQIIIPPSITILTGSILKVTGVKGWATDSAAVVTKEAVVDTAAETLTITTTLAPDHRNYLIGVGASIVFYQGKNEIVLYLNGSGAVTEDDSVAPVTYAVTYDYALRSGEIEPGAADDIKIYQPPTSVSFAALALTQRIYQNIEQGFDVAVDGLGGAPDREAGRLIDGAIKRLADALPCTRGDLMGVDGIDKLRARIPTAKRITEVAERTTSSAALVIQAEIQRVVPVDTGNLRRRIRTTRGRSWRASVCTGLLCSLCKASVSRKVTKGKGKKRKRQSPSGGKRYPAPASPGLIGAERVRKASP